MKSLNNYISEGFFNNIQADKEAMKESVIANVLDSLSELNKATGSGISCGFLISDGGHSTERPNKWVIYNYFKVSDNMLLQSNQKAKKYGYHGLTIRIGFGRKWNNESLKVLADVLEYFDPDTTTIVLKIDEKASGVSMKDITFALKGRLPKKIFTIALDHCNIDDWSWLDGVDEICNFDIYNSFIKSFKEFRPRVKGIAIGGSVSFDSLDYFPHITKVVTLAPGGAFMDRIDTVKDNMAPNAKLYK